MLKTDYLIRLFQELIQKLINLLLHRDTETLELEPQVFSQGCSLLDIKEDILLQMSAEETISVFSVQNYALEKLELAAYLALVKHQNEKTRELLIYVNEHSKNYSLERQYLLERLVVNDKF
jgi:hypothetical protein